ncbi:MAG: altronate dehydratase family protein [Clostridiales bacterium]|jgi:altronate hydrolase|nr:altronate dehydratase family protein [Clostridiales bacterium]
MRAIKINPSDNCAVCLEDIKKGEALLDGVIAAEDIPRGHKAALMDIKPGENVIKYGFPIGHATQSIAKGAWIHVHNVKTNLKDKTAYSYEPEIPKTPPAETGAFMGFRRRDGAGVRNEIWIIPTVGCVNSVAGIIAKRAETMVRGSVGDVFAFAHPYGCSQLGDDHENTKNILCALAKHPNCGGTLILGLGCENNGIAGMKERLNGYDPARIKFLTAQDEEDEVAAALELIGELIETASADRRESIPVSELVIGLKCGGSDGLSGITANPLVGAFSDMLIARGGSAILTEVPEMFGAETLLMNRCASTGEFNATVSMINGFKDYFIAHGQEIYENPSPGNKAGGITTLEEKSLGCTQKSGGTPVNGVLAYGERIRTKGLNLLYSPGNDLVASTALAAGGAQIVLFTTGRGTPFGSPVPTVKISSNTALFEKKPVWIDVNAGELVRGQSMDEAAVELYDYVIALASGARQTKTEEAGIRDMAIFKTGVTL